MSRITLTDLLAQASPTVRALNPDLFNGNPSASPALPGLSVSDQADDTRKTPKPKRRARNGSLAKVEIQKGISPRFFVRLVSYRVRLLDEDNLVGKWHTDLCRYCGFLPSDAPGVARIVTTQEKVGSKAEERVEIEIALIP